MSTIETDLEHDLAERVAQIGRKSRDARSAESTSAIELNLALRKLRHVDGLRYSWNIEPAGGCPDGPIF